MSENSPNKNQIFDVSTHLDHLYWVIISEKNHLLGEGDNGRLSDIFN